MYIESIKPHHTWLHKNSAAEQQKKNYSRISLSCMDLDIFLHPVIEGEKHVLASLYRYSVYMIAFSSIQA